MTNEKHPMLTKEGRRNYIKRENDEKRDLTLTRDAFTLWRDFDYPETRRLVAACAVSDWGENTACVFDIENKQVHVEHFDGRTDTLV